MGDKITATDIHIILIPAPPGPPIPTPLPHPFVGTIDTGCVTTVMIAGQPAAVVGAGATNTPPHIPQGGPFSVPPTNRATIMSGSPTVMIGGKPAARMGDTAITCDDVAPAAPKGIVAGTAATVLIG
jgi:uncharacterized Zn-binding protein involved in type VI secretion